MEIERLWLRSFAPPTASIGGDKFVQVGPYRDHGIAPHVWRAAHRAYVQHRLEHDLVVVAGIDRGLAGFAAFSLPDGDRQVLTIHYLYVLRPGRRRGIGRILFDAVRQYAADVPIRTTHTNNYWQRFFEAVRHA